MKTIAILSCCLWCEFTIGQTTFHTPPTWTIDLMKEQHQFALPSPLVMDDARRVATQEDWYSERRPQLLQQWMRILAGSTRLCGPNGMVVYSQLP